MFNEFFRKPYRLWGNVEITIYEYIMYQSNTKYFFIININIIIIIIKVFPLQAQRGPEGG